MEREQKQTEHVKGGYKIILETINHHQIHVIVPERTEIPEVLRVTINPIWSNKNLQVAEQMSDHEKNQNDAGNRDDHFFSNGRPIKSRQQSHDTELSTAENGSGGMCCPQRVAKSNTVGRRVEIEAAAGAITLHPTGLRMMGSGAMAI